MFEKTEKLQWSIVKILQCLHRREVTYKSGGGTNLKCVLAKRGVARENKNIVPKTEKFAKDKKKLTPQLAVSLDSDKKFEFSLIL